MPHEKKPPNPEELLFHEALDHLGDVDVNDFMLVLEMLANNPGVEVIRDSRGRPVIFRMRQN